MSLSSKFLQIKNSIKYKTLHPYKFYIFQHRYKFLREITIKKLLQEKEYIELNRKKTAKIFEPYFKEFENIEKETEITIKKIMSGNDEYAKQFKVTHYPEFLYSLVRYFDVTRCLETGVWWGVSSRYFLSAGKKNKQNFVLDSIDLPRLDVKNSEKYIGLFSRQTTPRKLEFKYRNG